MRLNPLVIKLLLFLYDSLDNLLIQWNCHFLPPLHLQGSNPINSLSTHLLSIHFIIIYKVREGFIHFPSADFLTPPHRPPYRLEFFKGCQVVKSPRKALKRSTMGYPLWTFGLVRTFCELNEPLPKSLPFYSRPYPIFYSIIVYHHCSFSMLANWYFTNCAIQILQSFAE